MVEIKETINLEELNERFNIWIRDDYHKCVHQGIKARPLDRYTTSTMSYPRKRIDLNLLNEHFMVGLERRVKKDATVSLNGKLYEVPARFIGQSVELRHVQGDASEIFIYEDDKRVTRITQLDAVANGRTYSPTKVEHISLTKVERK